MAAGVAATFFWAVLPQQIGMAGLGTQIACEHINLT